MRSRGRVVLMFSEIAASLATRPRVCMHALQRISSNSQRQYMASVRVCVHFSRTTVLLSCIAWIPIAWLLFSGRLSERYSYGPAIFPF